MSFVCPICNHQCKSNQKSIQCTSCLGWVHHNNRNNCSGITNTEFHDHCNNIGKYFECDKCCSKSICFLPFSNLDDNDWLNFNEIKSNYVSDDVNMITSAEDIKFNLNVALFKTPSILLTIMIMTFYFHLELILNIMILRI